MKLHEAIVQVLLEKGSPMTTQVIAKALNQNKYYLKKDGSAISSYQIHGRTKNYPHLFIKEGSLISLKSKTGHIVKPHHKTKTPPQKIKKDGTKINLDIDLMNPKYFKPTGLIDSKVPELPGVYCIRIKNVEALNPSLQFILKERQHNIIYIGLASQSLKKRLGQELQAKGHGTFFRSLGAVLGYTPPKGSLIGRKNQQNYKFSKQDEAAIIEWINKNLLVNWVECDDQLRSTEEALIATYLPLLNLAGNPGKSSEVTRLRYECKIIARSVS
tara:strand:- start:2311 stop:3126 length:816 start_codon:yes stop_codon:yes gene_type:complete